MTAGLASIVGQTRAIEQLRGALARGTLHHAYLFHGPDGVGKHTAARALAQAANCETAPGEGCERCDPCRKIAADLHPDIKWFPVLPEKGQTERVRELISQLGYPPNEARARLVILDPADELNDTAANVLLKTLEEPPSRTHFVLVTARPASLLVTIRSRCQRVVFGPLPDDEIARRLAEGHGVEGFSAQDAAALAQGSLGRALELATSEEFPRRRMQVRRLLEAARTRQTTAALTAAAEVAGNRDEAAALLEMMWIAYRDALLVSGGLAEGRVGGARLDEASWLAHGVPASGLLRGLTALTETGVALEGNVNPQLAFEALLFDLGRSGAI